jgi:hypothetical protein
MNDEIYQLLLEEIMRLRGKVELEPIFKEYIYDHLTDQEVLEIIKKNHISTIDLPQGLKYPSVLRYTLLFLEALKKCESWEQLKYVPPKKGTVNLDQLIDHLLKQKPPE